MEDPTPDPRPGKPAIIDGERVVTYAELDDRSNRVAHTLRSLGVAAGGRVAVMLPNRLEYFETGVAISKIDAGMVPVNCHLKADEVAWIVADSGAEVLVTDGSLLSASSGVGAVPVLDVDSASYLSGEGPPLVAGPAPAPVFYTSGTTGRPKGVVHGQHGLIDRDVMAMMQRGQAALWSWTADDVYLLSGPAYHAGPGGWASTALFVGATVVVMPSFVARSWLSLVDRHRVTKSFMVPAHFIRLLEVPESERAACDLSSLRLIVHAAAPCPADVKRRAMSMLAPCEVWELYGASEGGATRISPSEWLSHPGSVGLPWPGVEVRILAPDGSGRVLGPGQTGLVYVRPAGGVRFHYHDDADKTASAWVDDAFTVGDVGYVDDDGYLYLTDRASDMVIRGGVNVYPREVEEVLHRHPVVVDCAVFGVPDDRMGEQLHAMVEARSPVPDDELRAWCAALLADFKVPATFEVVDTLPRDASGKVRKRLLRDERWKGRPTAI